MSKAALVPGEVTPAVCLGSAVPKLLKLTTTTKNTYQESSVITKVDNRILTELGGDTLARMVVGFFLAGKCFLVGLVVIAVVIAVLPAALPTLPLELTVLYNSLLFAMGAPDSAMEGESEEIRQGLLRGKEIVLCVDAPRGKKSILSALEMCSGWLEAGGCEQGSLALLKCRRGRRLQPETMCSCLQGWPKAFKANESFLGVRCQVSCKDLVTVENEFLLWCAGF